MISLVCGGPGARGAKLFFLVYLQMKFSHGVQVEGIWSILKKQGVEISHCTSNWLFHRHKGRKFQFFPALPCTLVGFQKFPLHFLHRPGCSSCWCQIGHKGAPKCYRFCPGTFAYKFPSTEKARKLALQEHSSFQAYLAEAFHGGWNRKTWPSVCVCPSVRVGASLKVLHHGGWSTILNFFLFFFPFIQHLYGVSFFFFEKVPQKSLWEETLNVKNESLSNNTLQVLVSWMYF